MDKTRSTGSTHWFTAAAVGATLMYLFDPQQGRRRAALARDKLVHYGRCAAGALEVGVRDLRNRAGGARAVWRGALHRTRPTDEVLAQRVRTALGRLCSHPRSVAVGASDGRVTLEGLVLPGEDRRLVDGVRAIPGVRQVESRLEVCEYPASIPSLQGGRRRTGPRAEYLQDNWAPGPRLLALAAGSALVLVGARRSGASGALLRVAGAVLAIRAATRRSRGRARSRIVDIRKTIHIAAPPERVFDLWSDCANFPHFMRHVEEVRPLDETRSHWVVKGPAGVRLEWDAVVTGQVRPHMLAWRSVPEAMVQQAGVVRFDAEEDGTRVTVELSYEPPAGAWGHAVAGMLGRDPKHVLDADLMRMKSFVETGVAAHDAARPEPRRAQASHSGAPSGSTAPL